MFCTRYKEWLLVSQVNLRNALLESEDDDSASSDFDIDQYSCKEEKKFFKESPLKKSITLSEEVKERIQKAISKSGLFTDGVYDDLRVVEMFGEPWFHKTRVDYIMKVLKEPDDFIERHPVWISENLNEYRKI